MHIPSSADVIALRQRYGLTQTQAAEHWLTTLRTVQNWEAPEGTPNHRKVHPLMWWAMNYKLKLDFAKPKKGTK